MENSTNKQLLEIIKKQKAEIFELKTVIENLPGSIYWKDKNGVYLGRNRFFLGTASNFKYHNDWVEGVVIGKTDYDFFFKEAADIYRKHDLEVMEKQKELSLEEPATLKNGEKGTLLSIKRPIYNELGEVKGIVGSTADITYLKKIESELQEAKLAAEKANSINTQLLQQTKDALRVAEDNAIFDNRDLANFVELVTGQSICDKKSPLQYTKNIYNYMESIVASMPLSVYWLNRQGIYLGCNDNFARLFNLPDRHSIVGKSYNDLYVSESGDFYKAVDLEVMNTGLAQTLEEPSIQTDGTKTIWLSSKVPLRDSAGKVIGMLGISLDITERKKNEQELKEAKEAKEKAEAASLAKSEFLAVVSHELRIPLTGVIGMTKLLNTKNLAPNKQQEYLSHIHSAGRHLLNLINDILDFAKLEAAQMKLSPAPMDLKALIEETSTMLTPLAKAKNLELLIDFENTVPHKVLGDKRFLRQIITNLLGNAIKFTENGYVSIQVNCIENTSNMATLVILVSDTGIGIPQEKQGIIFDFFSQVDSSSSRRYGGAGLGLTITKQLVELMSGTISVISQIGKGTSFRCVIRFPLQKEAIMTTPWMVYESNVRVLIVDDTLRGNVIQKQISNSNSQVVSGSEAFNTLLASQQASDPYEVVILDQGLESINPFLLVQLIKKQKELHQPMLVLLVDDATAKTLDAARNCGFFECITKPIQPLALQIALTAAWERWVEQKEMKIMPVYTEKFNILLVEDDKIVQIVHSNYLQDLNCIVDIASTGKEALEKLQTEYDLVFLDMGLPDLHGVDVIKEFRKRTQLKKQTPVIALTGFGVDSSKQEFIQAGVDEVMVKPVFIEQLEQVIHRYCQAKSPLISSADTELV